ncbi:MAG: ABC transporter permease [Pseudomonadota bacterium]
MNLFHLGLKSLWSRRYTAILVLLTVAISTALLIGVERIRHSTKSSFTNTVSGVDLIVGARSGSISLLLYSVFRLGNPTNNITWESYRDFAEKQGVAWTIPLSLGDSHRGFRVLGTSRDYFEYYKIGRGRSLVFDAGNEFDQLLDVVLGAEVAEQLNYKIGDEIIIAHGLGTTSFSNHDDNPFTVSGILARTGTPVDRTLHVSLEAIEAIHVGWEGGVKIPGATRSVSQLRDKDLQPKAITAFMLGLESRVGVFKLQRAVNEYREEPLLAVLPGAALQELWGFMRVAENALWIISLFVVFAGFVGMIAVSLAGLNERRREIAVLRAVGASSTNVSALLIVESVILTAIGIVLGMTVLHALVWILQGIIETRFGIGISNALPTATEWKLIGGLLLAGTAAGTVPAVVAYKNTLMDGLTARV